MTKKKKCKMSKQPVQIVYDVVDQKAECPRCHAIVQYYRIGPKRFLKEHEPFLRF